MHALKPSPASPRPVRRIRTASARRHPHRAIAIETTVKLTVNLALSAVAIAALARLLPYRSTQEAKLQEVQTATRSAQGRLQQRQTAFSNHFDPYRSKALMQEYSNRIAPGQRQVVWQDAKANPAIGTIGQLNH